MGEPPGSQGAGSWGGGRKKKELFDLRGAWMGCEQLGGCVFFPSVRVSPGAMGTPRDIRLPPWQPRRSVALPPACRAAAVAGDH